MAVAVNEAAASFYDPFVADLRRLARRQHIGGRRISVSPEQVDVLIDEILHLLERRHSPEQIRQVLIKVVGHVPVSHTWFYEFIRCAKKDGGKLHLFLRRRGKGRRGAESDGRGQLSGRIDIDERPAAADNREEVGHWEIDTVIGARHRGALLTAVDRCSRLLVMRLMSDRTAAAG